MGVLVDSLWNCVKQKQLESFNHKKTLDRKDTKVMWIKLDGSSTFHASNVNRLYVETKMVISAPENIFHILFGYLVPSECTERGHVNMGYIYIFQHLACAVTMYHVEYKPRNCWPSWRKFNFCLPAIHACVGFKKSMNSFTETQTRQHY